MRLRADQVADHLARQGLAPVYHVSGDEPLQILEITDFIRGAARDAGCEERLVLEVGKDFDWSVLASTGAEMSLFAARRLIELRLGAHKPGKDGGAAIQEYLDARAAEDVLLVSSAKIEKSARQSRWFKAIEQDGVSIQVWPVESAQLPSWISQRVRAGGRKIDREAADLLAEKVEGNLLAAKQEIDKLLLLVEKKTIELQDIMDAVSDSSRYDVFVLVSNSLAGNIERMTRMLRGLQSEGAEPLAVFGALMWELRRVCSVAHAVAAGVPEEKAFYANQIWQQKKPAVKSILKRCSTAQIDALLRYAAIVDRGLKGAVSVDRWDILENFLFRIAGVRLQSFPGPETAFQDSL